MRVLVVSAWPPWPLSDGARLVLHHHLRHLAPRHEVTLLAAGGDPAAPDGATFAAETGPAAYTRRRARSWRTGEPGDVARVESQPLLAAFEREIARRPDIVHLHGWGTAQLGRAAGAAGLPVVHVAIDPWSDGLRAHTALPWWRRAIEHGEPARVARHERIHYPRCDRIVVVSEVDAAALRHAIPAARVVAVPNGVELGPEPAGDRPSRVIGFHGAMATPANADAAVRLVRGVLPRVPDTTVRIIGRDPLPAVRALAGANVTVTGAVDDVPAALQDVTVYVAPIERGSGIRNKVLEAMAAGLPVVATTRAVQGIGEGDGIVIADTDEDMAAAIAGLLDDPDRARTTGRAGRARVGRDFTWARAAAGIEAIWRELVDRSAAAADQ